MDIGRSSRLRDLMALWSWLPAFRVIAETEHLPSAAALSFTGPSSLSRALALLERSIGRPLFDRAGRGLRLNADGRLLLAAVRDAMRRVDEGLHDLRGNRLSGDFSIGSAGAGTTVLVAPALERLCAEHPDLRPRLLTPQPVDVAHELLCGQLDVAFQETPVHQAGLVTRTVGCLTRAVWCGRRHALFAKRDVSADDLSDGPFVAPPPGPDGVAADGWPSARPRNITLVVDQLRVGLELCLGQPLLAVLPDVLAKTRGDALRRLDAVPIDPTPVFAIHRPVIGPRPTAAVVLTELVAAASGGSAGGAPASG